MCNRKVISIVLLFTIVFNILSGYSSILAAIDKPKEFNGITEGIESSLSDVNRYDENGREYSRRYQDYLNLSDEEKAKMEVIPRMYDVPLDMLYENQVRTARAFAEETLPEYFNLNDVIDIEVENQDQYGLCWAFSSITPLETYLALRNENYDLSEMHLGYLSSGDFGYTRTLASGGLFSDFQRYVNNNYGPVLEEDVPYREYSEDEYDYLANLDPVVNVIDTIEFPAIDKFYNTYTDEELKLFRNKVKKHIMENGGLYTHIEAKDLTAYGKNALYYNGDTPVSAPHAVTTIGWDDYYAVENFDPECRPSKPRCIYLFKFMGRRFWRKWSILHFL